MRRYYLYARAGVFYARIFDKETGVALVARSTGKRDKDEALLVIGEWLAHGLPAKRKGGATRTARELADAQAIMRGIKKTDLTADDALAFCQIMRERGLIDFPTVAGGNRRRTLLQFLREFWDMEKSAYIQDKLAHGQRITRRYCMEQMKALKHWALYFGEEKALGTLTRQELRDFGAALKAQGKAAQTVNNITVAGYIALAWAAAESIIPANPSEGLKRFRGNVEAGDVTKREVLTEPETEALFSAVWQDKRTYTAALLAATTGLRAGEVLAIRKNDIGEAVLNVAHSWSPVDGLKTPKNGEARRAGLLPEVRGALLSLLADNPHEGAENPFVFYSETPERPMNGDLLLNHLKKAIDRAGIKLNGRSVTFHSFRHYYASRMADIVEADKVARITGHKSRAMAEHYQAHVTDRVVAELRNAAAGVFAGVLVAAAKRGGRG